MSHADGGWFVVGGMKCDSQSHDECILTVSREVCCPESSTVPGQMLVYSDES